MNTQEPIKVLYTNWRGEVALRTIVPIGIRYGSTDWHPEPQWLLHVHDVDKGAEREYALRDCVFADVDAEAVSELEVATLKRQFLEELLVKSAHEAKQEELAPEPGVDFPHGWFLLKHQDKPLAMFPNRDAAHSHMKCVAHGLAVATLRKVTSAVT